MQNQTPRIRSHMERVKAAKAHISSNGIKCSIFDREAFVEFFLLEDIERVYQDKYNKGKERQESGTTTRSKLGKKANELNVQKFFAIKELFKNIVEVTVEQLYAENYKLVWKSIPEHALMRAANSTKYLSDLKDMAKDLIKNILDEAIVAVENLMGIDDIEEYIEIHEGNVRKIKDLPDTEEMESLMKAAEDLLSKKAEMENLMKAADDLFQGKNNEELKPTIL